MGISLGACASPTGSPSPTVTVTETVRIEVSSEPSAIYGLMDPEVEQILISVCRTVDESEPSWDDMQIYGPYEDQPMQADMIALLGRQAERTYEAAFKDLNYMEQADRGNTLYGQVYEDLSVRSNYAFTLRSAAEDYLKNGSGYARLYYFWAAYAASIESNVGGCADYLD